MSDSNNFPGKRLGLSASGRNSLAPFWRRAFAILIDWLLSLFIANALFGGQNFATLVVFGVTQWLFIATVGFSIGQRLLGLRVRPLSRGWVGFWRSLIRVSLILLVLPPTIWDSDGRGLHDKAAGTVIVRL